MSNRSAQLGAPLRHDDSCDLNSSAHLVDALSCGAEYRERVRVGANDPYGGVVGRGAGVLRSRRLLTDRRPGAREFADAVILKTVGEVDIGLLSV